MTQQMNSIAYQNKDITSKVFAERFKGKSLKVYGLDIPKVSTRRKISINTLIM